MNEELEGEQGLQDSDHAAQVDQGGTAVTGDDNVVDVIEQQAGDHSIQIGKARDVTIHQYGEHPSAQADFLTPDDLAHLEQRYLKAVAEECRWLETEGVDRARAALTDVFVMLEAVESPKRKERGDVPPPPEQAEEMGPKERATVPSGRRGAEREKKAPPLPPPPPPPVPLSQALRAHNHLVILGEPGTGKTTMLQFVALCFAADGRAKTRLDLEEARVPVRVALREYDGVERLDRFLIRWLDRAYASEPLVQDWLTEGRLAVLLDGLDQVPERRRTAVVEAIERFATTPEGRHCRIIVTSRIAGYRQGRSLGANFGQYTIRPFAGSGDAGPYAAGWLQVLTPMTAEAAEAEAKVLFDAMEGQSGLRRIMGNPLLLRLAVTVYVDTGELAHSRAELYRRHVEEVAWKRAEAREKPRWSYKQVEAALEAVAWALQTQAEQTAAALGEVVEEATGVADGRELLGHLRERQGLLAVYGYERGDLVAFRHLTFQEYFVARCLARAWFEDQEGDWCSLRPRLHHPAWREPLLLLGGMLDEVGATNLVRRVLQAHSPYERELHRDLLLAAAIVGDGAPVPHDSASRVTDRLIRLYLNVRVKWRYRLIVPIGGWLFAIMSLWSLMPWHLSTLAWWGIWFGPRILGIIQLLVWWEWKNPGLEQLKAPLSMFPRLQAVSTFPHRWSGRRFQGILGGQIVNALVRLPISQQAQARHTLIQSLRNPKRHVRSAVIWPLGEIGEPEDVKSLTRMLKDGFPDIRRRAVYALGKIGDPRAVEPLIQALWDTDWFVCLNAADALGEIGDPRAVEYLIWARWAQHRATDALKAIGDRATKSLVLALGDKLISQPAAVMLVQIGRLAVEPLVQVIEDRDAFLRMASAKMMEEIRAPRLPRSESQTAGKLRGKINEQLVRRAVLALGNESEWRYRSAAKILRTIGEPAVESLIQVLEKDKSVRWEAAMVLGEIGDPRAVEPLIKALEDEKVRRVVIKALGKIGDLRAVEPIVQVLGNEYGQVRLAAARVLGKIGGPQAVASLIRILKDDDENMRMTATEALGKLGDSRATEALIQSLGDNGNGKCHHIVIDALGRIGDPQAVATLIQTLEYEDVSVRQRSAEALGMIGDQQATEHLIQALECDDATVRRAAAEALGKISDAQAVESLIQVLEETVPAVHTPAPTEVPEGLREDVPPEHNDANVRRAAAEALGVIGDFRAIEPLIRALGDEDEDVRQTAATALVTMADPKAVEPLIQVLEDEDAGMRQVGVKALGAIGDPPAVAALIQALGDKDGDVRRTAAEALRAIGEPAVEPLSRMLGDENEDVREAAERALGKIDDSQAVTRLIHALGDEDKWRRWNALEALVEIGDPVVEPLIRTLGDEDKWRRRSALEALVEIGNPAVELLIRALGDEDGGVRYVAAKGLEENGDPKAVVPLIRTLGDKDWEMRQTTARALGKIGDPQAVTPLIRTLEDEDREVRLVAAVALGAIGEKIEDRQTARKAARQLWWRLTDVEDVANAAWEAMAQVVARLTELEVEALEVGLPLFAAAPPTKRRRGE
ncbi:MAG: hypothetical protein GY832_45005 [Chloroflexi bacterium]|nr:hypothetical protein [Chloroflexota bacterium]